MSFMFDEEKKEKKNWKGNEGKGIECCEQTQRTREGDRQIT